MTSTGAVIARMASHSRAGEERYSAAALAANGVPIIHSVHGDGLFKGPMSSSRIEVSFLSDKS